MQEAEHETLIAEPADCQEYACRFCSRQVPLINERQDLCCFEHFRCGCAAGEHSVQATCREVDNYAWIVGGAKELYASHLKSIHLSINDMPSCTTSR